MEPQVPIEVEKPSPVARADSYATTSSEGSLFWAKKGQTTCLVQPSTLSLPVPGQEPSVTVVSFEPNDPSNPYNWSTVSRPFSLLTIFQAEPSLNSDYAFEPPYNPTPPTTISLNRPPTPYQCKVPSPISPIHPPDILPYLTFTHLTNQVTNKLF
jgi:hypothetical protein